MLIGGPERSLFRGVCGDVLCAERERTGASLSLVISDGGSVGEKKLTEDTEPSRPPIGGGRGVAAAVSSGLRHLTSLSVVCHGFGWTAKQRGFAEESRLAM